MKEGGGEDKWGVTGWPIHGGQTHGMLMESIDGILMFKYFIG